MTAVLSTGRARGPVGRALRADGCRPGGERCGGRASRLVGRLAPRLCAVDRERGSGTVLLLGVVAALLVLASALGLLVTAHAARARAQAAADLAALAGAAELRAAGGTEASACATARQTAARNRTELTQCRAGPGGTLRVRAVARVPVGLATADARAGPRPVDGT